MPIFDPAIFDPAIFDTGRRIPHAFRPVYVVRKVRRTVYVSHAPPPPPPPPPPTEASQ